MDMKIYKIIINKFIKLFKRKKYLKVLQMPKIEYNSSHIREITLINYNLYGNQTEQKDQPKDQPKDEQK